MKVLVLPQIGRFDLRSQARDILRTSIVTGELEPGRLYAIGAIAQQLGVSATPVREALGDLAHLGLVEIIPNRGFMVPALTDAALDEVFELRLLLEVPAIERCAGRLAAEDRVESRRLVQLCKEAAAQGDLNGFLAADRDFHLHLVGTLGNRRLLDILGRLRDETRLYGLRELAAAGRLVSSADEHQGLLDAIVAGDGKKAARIITMHLKHTRGAWAGRAE
jgi:DNA-binding GntR family transcriptional regulator